MSRSKLLRYIAIAATASAGLVAVVWVLAAPHRVGFSAGNSGPAAKEAVVPAPGEPGAPVRPPESASPLAPAELERLLLPLRTKSLAISEAYRQSVEGSPEAHDAAKTDAILQETAAIRAAIASRLEQDRLQLPHPATLEESLDFVAGSHAAARLLLLEAQADSGKKSSLQASLNVIRMARCFHRCGLATGVHWSYVYEQAALRGLFKSAARHKWSPDQLDLAVRSLKALGPNEDSLLPCVEEAAGILSRSFEKMDGAALRKELLNSGIDRRDLDAMHVEHTRGALAEAVTRVAAWLSAIDRPDGPLLAEPTSPDPIVRGWLPRFGRLAIDKRVTLARFQLTVIALRIEATRQRSGGLPDMTEDRKSDPLWLDPFSGGRMRYVTGPEGYRLYSVGPDRKDQEGKIEYRPKQDTWDKPSAGDIIVSEKGSVEN